MDNTLSPKEVAVIQLALQDMKEVLEETQKMGTPWNTQAITDLKDIYANCKSALEKITKISGLPVSLAKYEEGDEKEFFTKES